MFTANRIPPNLSFVVGQIAQASQDPDARHELEIKRVVRFLGGTKSYELHYSKNGNSEQLFLHEYSDSDWAGCTKTRKSVYR